MKVRVIALGSPHNGDDELALRAGERLREALGDEAIELKLAGRPGPGLVDLLSGDDPVLVLDVVRSGAAAGTVHRIELAGLPEAAAAQAQLSSHGFGPAEALKLARALDRPLPAGEFVGIEGARFEPGAAPSPAVVDHFEDFLAAARASVASLREQTHA